MLSLGDQRATSIWRDWGIKRQTQEEGMHQWEPLKLGWWWWESAPKALCIPQEVPTLSSTIPHILDALAVSLFPAGLRLQGLLGVPK